MDQTLIQYLTDYGLAFVVMAGIIYWLAKSQSQRLDKNTESVQMLTQAITALVQSNEHMYEICEKAFNDNRETIQILMNHIEKGKE
ncbi:MAG: hypothetical protein IJK97_00770 [Thermoguttaceae bacterium]|nr:hypothetical protein [Thermoguttaceae bacterium]MBR0190441.1 hypothetical protein [Thermoguttaceae bacterium]